MRPLSELFAINSVFARVILLPFGLLVGSLVLAWLVFRPRSTRGKQLTYAAAISVPMLWEAAEVLQLVRWRPDALILFAVACFALAPVGIYYVVGQQDALVAEARRREDERGGRPLASRERLRQILVLGGVGLGLTVFLLWTLWPTIKWAMGGG